MKNACNIIRNLLFIIIIIISINSCATTSKQLTRTYSQKDTILFEGIKYIIYDSFWVNENKLIILIGITNAGDTAIQFPFKPSFSLIDAEGRRYEARLFDFDLGQESINLKLNQPLNPNVEIEGMISFDASKNNSYKLMVISPNYAKVGFAGSVTQSGPYFFVTLSPGALTTGDINEIKKAITADKRSVQDINKNDIYGRWEDPLGRVTLEIHNNGKIFGKAVVGDITKIISGKLKGNTMSIISMKEDKSDRKELNLIINNIVKDRMVAHDSVSGKPIVLKRIK
jgi:hypothetical protein